METDDVARRLQTWFATHQRDLPWRRDPTPYNVLLSEFILQQTRMEVGLRYFEQLRSRFPTLDALARARESSVLAAWSGLGYYRRARNLHKAARQIRDHHGGQVPSDPRVLQTLPGIGPYTAGAIASIAFDQPEPSLDGNQLRVLGRLVGQPATTVQARRRLAHVAQEILRHGSPRAINQAIMDLGSSICTPRSPQCSACPLRSACASQGAVEPDAKAPRAPVQYWRATVHRDGDRFWLARPRAAGLLAGLWLPPMRSTTPHRGDIEHVFSHVRWRIQLHPGHGKPAGPGRWVREADLARLPHASLTRKLLAAAKKEIKAPQTGRGRARTTPAPQS